MDDHKEIRDEKQEVVESFKLCGPLFKKLLTDDISIAIVERDTRKTLFYQPGDTIDHGIREGDLCPEKSVVVETAQTGEKISRKAGSETFGFPYFSQGLPIYDRNGNVIAGIALSKSLEKYQKLMNAVDELKKAVDIVGESSHSLAANSEELLAISEELSSASEKTISKASETGEVLKMIEKVTGQTKLLGLNASIEAARLGEQGRGFNVVANEIQKLAQNSVDSLKQIEEILGELPETTKVMNQNIENIREVGSKHAEDATDVDAMIQKLTNMSEELTSLAEEL